MPIEVATIEDVPRIAELVRRFLAESIYGGIFPFEPTVLEQFVARAVEPESWGIVFVSREQNQIVGMIAGAYLHEPISGTPMAEELAWWVEPEARGGLTAIRLHRMLEVWAESRGAQLLKMVAPADKPDVGVYYGKQGYRAVEVAWIKPLGGPHDETR